MKSCIYPKSHEIEVIQWETGENETAINFPFTCLSSNSDLNAFHFLLRSLALMKRSLTSLTRKFVRKGRPEKNLKL